jgi:hypothetical protein
VICPVLVSIPPDVPVPAAASLRPRIGGLGPAGRSVAVMPEHDHEHRPSPRALFANWASYDASFGDKLRMAASNTLVKLRKRQSCCGNYGEPGC